MLMCNLLEVSIEAKSRAKLQASAVTAVGFDPEDGVIPFSKRSFTGNRLLQEYFAFPEKFLFFDLKGTDKAWVECGADDYADVYFLFGSSSDGERYQRLEMGIAPQLFRLNCAPVVNLFEQTCEPIQLDQKRYEYAILPDLRRPLATEIHSIDRVTISTSNSDDLIDCLPFYSPQREHAPDKAAAAKCFWTSHRRPSARAQDPGSDVFVSTVDRSGRSISPSSDVLTIRCTCTNRDLPSRLPFGTSASDFELDGNAPVARIVALRKPTATLRPPSGPGSLWNLISHLSLNYLSLVEDGKEALQTLLSLCDYAGTSSSRRVLDGITEIRSRPHFAGMNSEQGLTFTRGVRVELTLDEEQFVGGAYLFAAVLERFFAQYCSVNSFSQLSARSRQRKELLREWRPRAGNRLLL
jgi:type VI secretion system protein ImpG